VAVALGPPAGKLGDVEDSSANAFLPRGAESARVNTELEKFRTDTVMPAVVVYTGDGAGEKAAADRTAFAKYVPARRAGLAARPVRGRQGSDDRRSFRKLQHESRQTPYPLEEIRRIGGMYSSSID
jgi:RND superfamily putative drug exporter